MLSKSTNSGKIKHSKIMGDKLRIQIGVISNITNTNSDIGNILCFFYTRNSLEPLVFSSLKYGSKANDIEFLKVLPSVNNYETVVQLISRLRS